MANVKSAIKRVKTTEARRLRNAMSKSFLRTTIKKSKEALTKGDETANEMTTKAIKVIDQSVSKGILHKNTAARKKSKIAKAFNALNSK